MNDEGGYFGLCPECGRQPTYVNVERNNIAVCGECRVCWSIGWNLFSSWRDETETDWERNRALLAECREVKPAYPEWVQKMMEEAAKKTPLPASDCDPSEIPF